jgi:Mn-dependent DtxR family transcriptional regulator
MKDDEINEIAEEITKTYLKGSPRSKLVEAVIILLHARPLRTSEIASNLGYETKYISSYLSYWKRKGLVYQEGGRWYLSPDGENLAKSIIDSYSNSRFREMLVIAKQVLEPVNQSINNNNHKTVQKRIRKFCRLLTLKPVIRTINDKIKT